MRRISTKRDGNAGILEDGVYLLKIEDAEEKTSPNSGNDYLQLRLSVIQNGEPFGRSIWDILSFTENARFKFDQIFEAMEAPEDAEVTGTWFVGKRVYAQIKTDEYNGNLKNIVKTYLTKAKGEELMAKQRETMLEGNNGVPYDEGFGEAPVERAGKKTSRKSARPADVDDDMPL